MTDELTFRLLSLTNIKTKKIGVNIKVKNTNLDYKVWLRKLKIVQKTKCAVFYMLRKMRT